MEEAYEFLRTLEHRIQLHRLRRTHIVPDDPEDLRRIGRSMGFRHNPAESLEKEWQAQKRVVRRLHEKLFYQPLLEAVAAIPTDRLRLTPEAAEQRLTALGFVDPSGALAHIRALTSGVSRRASIQRSLLPAMLEWFAAVARPGRRPARVPQDLRGPGRHALVPAQAPRRGGGRRAALAGRRIEPLRHRPDPAGAGLGGPAR